MAHVEEPNNVTQAPPETPEWNHCAYQGEVHLAYAPWQHFSLETRLAQGEQWVRRMSETPSTTSSPESIAIHLRFVLQCTSNLWCNAPPICIVHKIHPKSRVSLWESFSYFWHYQDVCCSYYAESAPTCRATCPAFLQQSSLWWFKA